MSSDVRKIRLTVIAGMDLVADGVLTDSGWTIQEGLTEVS